MKKILYGIVSVILLGGLGAPVSAISLAPCPDDEYKAECEKERAEILRRQEAGEPIPRSVGTREDVRPTFIVESDEAEQSAGLWFGKNLLLAGNNLATAPDVEDGLLLVAGNSLELGGDSEYGFVFGNVIKYTGTAQRDLYVAGNSITLDPDASIGRDVFAAGNKVYIGTDLAGDLSVTANHVVIEKGLVIDGNVNIDAEKIEIGNDVEIVGKLTYNDNAHISDLRGVTYGGIEAYHVAEISPEVEIISAIYGKLLSIAGLFLVMALIIAFYPKLHEKVQQESSAKRFGINLALGCGVVIILPMFIILAFLTIVAAPLGIIGLLMYLLAIYLAQGFTGLWLGHLIIEKLFKLKGNTFAELLTGIFVLGMLALVPFIGVVTGLLSMLFGLGLIVNCVKPSKEKGKAKLPKSTNARNSQKK